MSRGRIVGLWVLAGAIAIVGEAGFLVYDQAPFGANVALGITLDVVVGFVTMAAGIVAWSRRPGNRMGPLLFAAGAAWSLSGVYAYGVPAYLFSAPGDAHPLTDALLVVGSVLLPVHYAILLHLLLAYPEGLLHSRLERALVAGVYGLVGLRTLAILTNPADNAARFLVGEPPFPLMSAIAFLFFSAVALTAFLILGRRWMRSTPTARRIFTPVLGAALLLALVEMISAGANLLGDWGLAWASLGLATASHEREWIFYAGVVAKLAVPLAFLFGMFRGTIERTRVGDLVIELGATELGATQDVSLRDALARTLHDPTVELAYWLPSMNEFVDVTGRPVSLPVEGSPRTVTLVERQGEPLAAIIHDRSLLDEPALVGAAAAASLAIDNERLHAEVRAKLEEVKASRARIVEAGDAERRRVERNLHDGAQQRLVSVSLAVGSLKDQLDREGSAQRAMQVDAIGKELRQALAELRELARGIHPAILTEEGLVAAVDSLADRSPVPVSVEDGSVGRLPEAVEATAYFMVAEALTNVVKYAHASRASVRLLREANRLRVEVADDGAGGVDPSAGSGLRSLEDRIVALGGGLTIESGPASGTTVRAEIPFDGR
jgi:signal transduction histidine kinase